MHPALHANTIPLYKYLHSYLHLVRKNLKWILSPEMKYNYILIRTKKCLSGNISYFFMWLQIFILLSLNSLYQTWPTQVHWVSMYVSMHCQCHLLSKFVLILRVSFVHCCLVACSACLASAEVNAHWLSCHKWDLTTFLLV